MALASEQLGAQHLGPGAIAGGLSAFDPLQIAENEAALCTNFRQRLGLLEFRDQLRTLITFDSAPTGRVTRLDFANFRSDTRYVMLLDKAHIWSWDGSGVTVNITGTSITSGSDTQPWSSAMGGAGGVATGDAGFFACNGANELIYWPGTGNAVKLNGHASYTAVAGNPANLIGRYVAAFAGRIFIGYTFEGGANYAQRLRWCSDSDFFNWNASLRQGAGAADIADTGGAITGLAVGFDSLIILKTDAIVFGRETGDVATPLSFALSIGIGCIAGQSFAQLTPTTAAFLGADNVYLLNGTDAQPIGDKIRSRLFADLNQSNLQQIVGFARPDKGLYYLTIPLSGSTQATRAYVYNYVENFWSGVEDYPGGVHSAATVLIGAGGTSWADLQSAGTTWDALETAGTAWSAFGAGTSAPRTLVGTSIGATSWRVHQFVADGIFVDTAALVVDVTAEWKSKIFRLNPTGFATVKGVWIYLANADAGAMTVEVIGDGAISSSTQRVIATSAQRVFMPLRLTAMYHQLRLVTTKRYAIRAIEVVHQLRRTG